MSNELKRLFDSNNYKGVISHWKEIQDSYKEIDPVDDYQILAISAEKENELKLATLISKRALSIINSEKPSSEKEMLLRMFLKIVLNAQVSRNKFYSAYNLILAYRLSGDEVFKQLVDLVLTRLSSIIYISLLSVYILICYLLLLLNNNVSTFLLLGLFIRPIFIIIGFFLLIFRNFIKKRIYKLLANIKSD